MNTKILLSLPFLIILSGLVLAVPNYEVHKYTSVNGDWKWDQEQWNHGSWQTASYQYDGYSNGNGYYVEPYEWFGTAWSYELEAHVGMENGGNSQTEFHTTTVNDPATTPATGGYTRYNYEQHNYGLFTESHLLVLGEGDFDLLTNIDSEGELSQDILVGVNSPL